MASQTNRRLSGMCLAGAVALAALTLGACSATQEAHHAGDIAALRKDPSPAMENLYSRNSDKRNRRAWARDTNLRMIHDDMASFWHYDKPSRLSPVTKPY